MSASADSHLRSLLKGLSWRVTATTSTVIIAVMVTGDAEVALAIGGIEAVAKFLIYYGHERLWLRIPLGRADLRRGGETAGAEGRSETSPAESRGGDPQVA